MTIFCIFEYSIFIQFHIRISNIFEYGKFPTKWAILKQNPLRIDQVTAKYASPIAICLYDFNFAFESWCKNRNRKDKTANSPPYERWGYGNIFVQIFDLIFEYSNIAQVQKIFEFWILFIFTGGSTGYSNWVPKLCILYSSTPLCGACTPVRVPCLRRHLVFI